MVMWTWVWSVRIWRAPGWMNVEWHTFVMCVGNLTFMFCNSLLCLSLSSSFFPWVSSYRFCVNNIDLSPLTDSYFGNKLLTHQLLFEMTYSSFFFFQNMRFGALMLTNSKTRCSGKWLLEDKLSCILCMYTKFDGVISRKVIIAQSISF